MYYNNNVLESYIGQLQLVIFYWINFKPDHYNYDDYHKFQLELL